MKNILIVDDNKDILATLSRFISGYDENLGIVKAMNGREAVEILKLVGVDLILTDIQMPVMDGFALIEHRNRQCPHVPLMVMTGSVTPDLTRRLSALAISDVIVKPFDYHDLMKRIEQKLSGNKVQTAFNSNSLLEQVAAG